MALGYWKSLISLQADGPTLTAAAAATAINTQAKVLLPGNFYTTLGEQIRVKASGRISSVITTPGTARFDLRFGANVVMDSLAILLDTVAAHTTVGWELEMTGTIRALGSTANMIWSGKWTCEDILGVPATAPKGVLSAILPWNAAPAVGANFDASATQLVDFFFTQTAATGSMTVHQYQLEAQRWE